MTNLISCPCGHTLGRHNEAGCHGAQIGDGCTCTFAPSEALDAAVAAVRRPGPSMYEFEAAENANASPR